MGLKPLRATMQGLHSGGKKNRWWPCLSYCRSVYIYCRLKKLISDHTVQCTYNRKQSLTLSANLLRILTSMSQNCTCFNQPRTLTVTRTYLLLCFTFLGIVFLTVRKVCLTKVRFSTWYRGFAQVVWRYCEMDLHIIVM